MYKKSIKNILKLYKKVWLDIPSLKYSVSYVMAKYRRFYLNSNGRFKKSKLTGNIKLQR